MSQQDLGHSPILISLFSVDKKSKFSRKRHNEDEGDVTYINEKNKQFNQKLDRFYNKYTAEIRDSFERGTMI